MVKYDHCCRCLDLCFALCIVVAGFLANVAMPEEIRKAEDRFWCGLQQRFRNSGLAAAFETFDAKHVGAVDFQGFLQGLCTLEEPFSEVDARELFTSLALQAHDSFEAGDFVRAHSSWGKRSAKITETQITPRAGEVRVRLPNPDMAGSVGDLRMDHQLLRSTDGGLAPTVTKAWHYPAPSGEVETRRVLDFWRGVPAQPWSSLQEAHQHFRRAFAFFDTDADGRVREREGEGEGEDERVSKEVGEVEGAGVCEEVQRMRERQRQPMTKSCGRRRGRGRGRGSGGRGMAMAG